MPTDSSHHGQTVRAERAAFQNDFEHAAAGQDDADCLTPEEILALQAGATLDSVANEHLTHCGLCSALKQAIKVDPIRREEFQRTVRETESVHQAGTLLRPDRQPSSFEWRLPAAAMAAFASLAVLILLPKYAPVAPAPVDVVVARSAKPLQIPNAGIIDANKMSNRVQIALQPPSGPPLRFVSTAPITVKDVAPQVATAAVLARSAVNAPPQLTADVTQQASDIVYRYLTSAVTDKTWFTGSASVAYLPSEKAYQLTLSGGKALVPQIALEDGQVMQEQMLTNSALRLAIASHVNKNRGIDWKTPLADGYVVSINSAKPRDGSSAPTTALAENPN